jgi:molybdopterin molybdotransferase
MSLLPVSEALFRILDAVMPLGTETISIHDALHRVLAVDAKAKLTQPPFDASAMDGYVVRFDDISEPLTLVGESQAGKSFQGVLGCGETVRIFTGAPMVEGADTVIIQENVTCDGNQIIVNEAKNKGENIRAAGSDFKYDNVLVQSGTKLNARHIALLAAGNVFDLTVFKRPRVAVLSTGDELEEVGNEIGPDQIVNSNMPMFMALVREHGGIATNIGIARDTEEDVRSKIRRVKDFDIFVSIGGVSVGDYDIIQKVLKEEGLKVDFWKVAMQPGKPIVFGDFKGIHYFGMPGNPSSSYVCFVNFMLPAMNKLQGLGNTGFKTSYAHIEHDLAPGGSRTNYMRATLSENDAGETSVSALLSQSSGNLSPLVKANCLLIRQIDAPAAKAGDLVKIVLIE